MTKLLKLNRIVAGQQISSVMLVLFDPRTGRLWNAKHLPNVEIRWPARYLRELLPLMLAGVYVAHWNFVCGGQMLDVAFEDQVSVADCLISGNHLFMVPGPKALVDPRQINLF